MLESVHVIFNAITAAQVFVMCSVIIVLARAVRHSIVHEESQIYS